MNYDFIVSGAELGRRTRKERVADRRERNQAKRDDRRADRQEAPRQQLIETVPNVAKVKILPLGQDAAGAAATPSFNLVKNCQNLFHVTRVILSVDTTTSLDEWRIDSLTVGDQLQQAAKGTFPAEMFGPLSEDTEVDFDMLVVGQEIEIEGTLIVAALAANAVIQGGCYGDYFESVNLRHRQHIE